MLAQPEGIYGAFQLVHFLCIVSSTSMVIKYAFVLGAVVGSVSASVASTFTAPAAA